MQNLEQFLVDVRGFLCVRWLFCSQWSYIMWRKILDHDLKTWSSHWVLTCVQLHDVIRPTYRSCSDHDMAPVCTFKCTWCTVLTIILWKCQNFYIHYMSIFRNTVLGFECDVWRLLPWAVDCFFTFWIYLNANSFICCTDVAFQFVSVSTKFSVTVSKFLLVEFFNVCCCSSHGKVFFLLSTFYEILYRKSDSDGAEICLQNLHFYNKETAIGVCWMMFSETSEVVEKFVDGEGI